MPAGEIAAEALGGIARFVGRIVFEIVFELLVRGTGYAVLKTLRPSREPGETSSAVVGLLIWAAVAAGGFWLYTQSAA